MKQHMQGSIKYQRWRDQLNVNILINIEFFILRCLNSHYILPLSMLRLPLCVGKYHKNVWKFSRPCHVCIHLKSFVVYYSRSTKVPGLQSFFIFCYIFALAKLTTSSDCKRADSPSHLFSASSHLSHW